MYHICWRSLNDAFKTAFFSCVQWYVFEKNIWAVPLYQGILTLFVVMNFGLATFMDPGVIPRGNHF
jgi:palmitoyltransferase